MSSSRLDRSHYLILALAAAAALLLYVVAARFTYGLGFPLDDAWIHQTYARNLGWQGEFSFRLGQPSAGSTAPLWSSLLAVGYALRFSPLWWVAVLGWGVLFGTGVLAEKFLRQNVAGYAPRWPWVGLFFTLEWHQVWAALSGMETALVMLGVAWVLTRLLAPRRGAASLGLFIGGMVWLRPDAITLVGPALVTLALDETHSRKARWSRLGLFDLTLGVPLAFYALFNLLLDGTVLPNTFYAKQTEYAILLQQPLWHRLGMQFLMPLIGAGLLLLPGWGYWLKRSWEERNWAALSVAAWIVGYLMMFALRLPVTYQHGRYQMPVMSIFFLTAFWGLLHWPSTGKWALPVSAWRTSIAAVSLAFVLLGAKAYAADVAFIESTHVQTAQWVAENLPPDALLAVHDIGALGYFAPQPLLDMAGLISAEVIPFLRDEAQLAAWLNANQADYLIVFTGWYNDLTLGLTPIFCSQESVSPQQLCVYPWR